MRILRVGAAIALLGAAPPPDPRVLALTLPGAIEWQGGEDGGPQVHLLWGDPARPGPYALLARWLPHRMSRPHSHPHDRIITVISGTWWLGTGATFDPEATTPVPAGTLVRHFAGQLHYDGAKDEAVVIEIVGEGPQ
jgi:hypothetical protein